MNLVEIRALCSHISLSVLGRVMYLTTDVDKKSGKRVYLQVYYNSPSSKNGNWGIWKGSKHYLSEHMTDDEIVKRAYVAFEQAVKHEVMEGFKFDGITVFNPHVNFRELLKISHLEIQRDPLPEPIVNFDI